MTMPPPPARHSSPKPCGAAPLCRACLFLHNLSSRHQSRRRTRAWTTSHVRSSRRYQPPRDSNICLKLRKERKELAGCSYQLLTGHASIDVYLAGMVHTIRSSERWWCGSGEQQPRHHFFVNCRAWAIQIKGLRRSLGKACEWKHPRAPFVRLHF